MPCSRTVTKSVFTCAIIIIFIVTIITYIEQILTLNELTPFNTEINTRTFEIPNHVHFILFDNTKIDFIQFLAIASAIKVHRPNRVLVHCNCHDLSGHYWNLLVSLSTVAHIPIDILFLAKPTHVFGQKISSVYHSADVARIQVLMNHGGIYLDTDTVVLKPLNQFLHYDMVIGWPFKDYIGNQILIADKSAHFLKIWLNGYKQYKPFMWYYNAGQYPTDEVLVKNPGLVHRVPVLFGVHNLLDKLHGSTEWHEWKKFYTIHLLSRHPPAPQYVNETNVEYLDTPFGELTRWLLYYVKPVLNSSTNSWLL